MFASGAIEILIGTSEVNKMKWTMTIPVISTGHVPGTFVHDLKQAGYTVAYYPEGAFICVGEDIEGVPEAYRQVLEWHKENGKDDWLRLDRDGDVIEGLPVFDW